MGIDIDKVNFSQEDYSVFQNKLDEQLLQLKQLLESPKFGRTQASLGAELELYIVDDKARPLAINETILAKANNPLLAPELNRYNLEYNLNPCELAAKPFITLENDIVRELGSLNQISAHLNGRVVPIGILPTLLQNDFGPQYMTKRKRYQALLSQLDKQRGAHFHIDIDGKEPLQFNLADITLEGANTSFQIHYTVPPKYYADTYNAIQLVTPLAIALGANSPSLFGHELWAETRIPLFKQSIDTRHVDRYEWNEPARVNFGHGWLREGAYELFKENVSLYPPLIPIITPDTFNKGGSSSAPQLAELCLHQGTVWLWNRPVYDGTDNGHLRIEMRALPSGPTAIDMMANAAFLIGLAEGMRESINELLPAIPFQSAEYNFYRCAQFGLDADVIWPNPTSGHQRKAVTRVIEESLPTATKGLEKIGIKKTEINRYLAVIKNRLQTKQNGSEWQKSCFANLNQHFDKQTSLAKMLELFIANSQTNTPVADWPIGDIQ